MARVIHPFPTVLTAGLTVAIALLAGVGWGVAARLGAAMFALQASIGTVNDVVDADADAVGKPEKPIPRGLVGPRTARAIAVAALGVGLALVAPSGPATIAVAIAGVGAGYAYDLRLKGTPWGPLAFAIGVPLLPVFAWVGATGALPAPFVALLPAGILAGLGLALANALADLEADRRTATLTAALRLGGTTAWRVHALSLGGALVIVTLSIVNVGAVAPGPGVLGVGAIVTILGIGLTGMSDPQARHHGWEVEAAGVGIAAAGWIVALRPVMA